MTHDIFISYSRDDVQWARAFAAALRKRGWTVFLDEEMAPGVEWRPEIYKAVVAAKAVIVIWSARSKRSHYVTSEVTLAATRNTLVPVRMEQTDPPRMFAHVQVEDMSVSGASRPPWALVQAITARLAAPAGAVASAAAESDRAQIERYAELSSERGVPLLALQEQLERLGDVAVAPDQLPARIESFVSEFLKLKTDFSRATNADPEVAATHRKARDLLDTGDLDQARKLFDNALVEVRQRRQQMAREEATLLADRARIDVMQVRYADAIAAYAEAADLVRFDTEGALDHLESLVDVLTKQGEEFGDNAALARAIETIRKRSLPLVPRKRAGEDWARLQVWLGNALWALGERESGTERLEEAVSAYRAALEEYTRERAPLNWAVTHMNLGVVLRSLGDRESGTERLEEAASACRAALEELTRERVPLDWARAQLNLGTVLWRLGQRESGTARLEAAVLAYRAALEERTRERVPLNWAKTQWGLGSALLTLGERESGTARLEEAVSANRAALEEYTRERVPLDWAATHHNLGAALGHLGDRQGDRACLEEAVAAFRAALTVYTGKHLAKDRRQTRAGLTWAQALLAKHRK